MNTIPPIQHPGGTADTLILSPGEIRGITNIAMSLATARARWTTRPQDVATQAELKLQINAARAINERYRATLVSDVETLDLLEERLTYRQKF